MGELREIVDIEAVGRLFALLAMVGPVAGLLLGAAGGARKQDARGGAGRGLLIGLFGPLNWLLWRVFNLLTDRNGLDTVQNVLINLALFVVVGAVIGALWGLALRRSKKTPPPETGELVGAGVGSTPPPLSAGAARRFEESDEPPREP